MPLVSSAALVRIFSHEGEREGVGRAGGREGGRAGRAGREGAGGGREGRRAGAAGRKGEGREGMEVAREGACAAPDGPVGR